MKRYTIEDTTVRPLVEGFLWLRDPLTGNDIAEVYLDFEGEGDEPTPESLRRLRMLAAAPEMEELVRAQAEAYAEGVFWGLGDHIARCRALLRTFKLKSALSNREALPIYAYGQERSIDSLRSGAPSSRN